MQVHAVASWETMWWKSAKNEEMRAKLRWEPESVPALSQPKDRIFPYMHAYVFIYIMLLYCVYYMCMFLIVWSQKQISDISV